MACVSCRQCTRTVVNIDLLPNAQDVTSIAMRGAAASDNIIRAFDLLTTSAQIRRSLAACNAAVSSGTVTEISGCISDATIGHLQRTGPAGVGAADIANQSYLGKVVVLPNGSVEINLSVAYSGDVVRAQGAATNISRVFGRAGVAVNFSVTTSASEADLAIHGAGLEDFIAAGVACSCNGAQYIGGYGPFYESARSGFENALYVNAAAIGNSALLDAHEFAHKLGLRHRARGIVAYPPNQGPVSRDDVDRIRSLYGGVP